MNRPLMFLNFISAGEKYDFYYGMYQDNVMARGHLDPVGTYEAIDGDGTTSNSANIACRIVPQEDYKFGLLREWTLWDSMVNRYAVFFYVVCPNIQY